MEAHVFTLELTPQDCAQASALLAGKSRLRRIGPALIVAVSLGVGGLIALATVQLGKPAEARRAFGLGAALCALFLGLQYLMLLRIALQTTRRSIESSDWCQGPVNGRLDSEGIAFDGPPLSLAWRDLRRCIEGTDHFAITSSSHPPIVLPRRALSPQAQHVLRAATVRA